MAGPVSFKPPAGRSGTAIPTVLADDEALALDELAFLLREFPEIEIVGTARNGIEAVQCIEECEPDLVFLDVQMPGLDGLGVIHKLKVDKAPMPAFVLCTAYEQYALEAFRLEAMDYLLKPVDRDRLAQTVERVKRSLLEPELAITSATVNTGTAASGPVARAKLLVKANGRNLIVDASDLIYATIEDGLITVVTTAVEGQTNYKTIEELQSSLDPATFWRAHRGYVVNINHIREVIPWFKSSYQLRMDDKKGTEIPVSRVQTKRLRELFKL
ncbi:LytR/AlgR family response regulator transcription factor [Paludibaculum fermentans]|uniref:Response regulator transcription factor n=1 Tax=Paludibaculum fermentans TaxID=1473598 RepID=A0A7S7NVL4_PALFE|nr:LytTR family DNA-binding domain-containing protein [Paludibaculum fermentans]QOY90616.1 response regulator transcription factor [Paludibaculum fermentans]